MAAIDDLPWGFLKIWPLVGRGADEANHNRRHSSTTCDEHSTISAAWKEVKCKDDPIQDLRMCYVRGDTVYVMGAGNQHSWTEAVRVGHDHYPGSDLVFRVDQNPVISWPERDVVGRSAELIEQMVRGRRVLSRFTIWPSGTTEDGTDDLTGFADKLQEMRRRLHEYAPQ
jgi:hypothetical protein